LQNILQITSPNIWQSLLSFNIGVELGQLIIVLLVWPLFQFLHHVNSTMWRAAQIVTATGCIAVACWWTIIRVGLIVESLG
jgi:hypothetical protein